MMEGIWKAIAKTSGAKIYKLILGIVSLSLTARLLGPEGRGQFAAITTLVGTFVTIGYMSLGQVAIKEAAGSKGTKWLRNALGTLIFWAIVVSVAGGITALLIFYFTDGSLFGHLPGGLLLLGFFMLPFLIWEHYGSSLLMALDRLNIYNRYQVIGSSLSIVTLLILLLIFRWGVKGVIIATLMGSVVSAIGGFFLLCKLSGMPKLFDWFTNVKYLKSGLTLHLNAVGAYLFTASDILMLNYYRGAEETGYYQLGVRLTGVMMIIPGAASMVLYGKISTLGPDAAWPYQRRLLLQICGLVMMLAGIVGFTAQWWIIWFAGDAFAPTISVFHWQLLSVVGMTFSVIMSSQWIGRGYFWQASSLTLFVGLGNVAANMVLIPKYGMYGAVWASLGVYMLAIVGNGAMAIHCQKRFIEKQK